MNVYRLNRITYVLGVLTIIVNFLTGLDFLLGALEPLQTDFLFSMSLLIFIPILFTILALIYKNLFCMYISSVISILLGLYLLSGEGIVQLYGGLQFLYLITTILMKIDISKAKKDVKSNTSS